MAYSIDANTKKISITRGDTFRVQIEIIIDDMVYTPVNGDVVRFSMKKNYASNVVLIHKEIPHDTMVLTIEPQDTKELPFGYYVYDVEVSFDHGDVYTFISGLFELLPEVE